MSAGPLPRVSPSTRNRYRSALLQFGRWLVEHEIIETNPVRDVQSSTENAARDVHYSMTDAKRLVDAQPQPHRTLGALMAASASSSKRPSGSVAVTSI